jgi:hypothetical protein
VTRYTNDTASLGRESSEARRPSASQLSQAKKPTDRPVRALLDVMGGQLDKDGNWVDVPRREFGRGKARLVRKLIMLAIAASADPDGTNAYPGLKVIARRALVSERAARTAISWWRQKRKGLRLKVQFKGGPINERGRTNRYTIIFPDQEALGHAEIEVPGVEPNTRNDEHTHPEEWGVTCGRMGRTPGSSIAANRPYNRPANRPQPPKPEKAAAAADESDAVLQEASKAFREETGRPFGHLPGKRAAEWSELVAKNGAEIVVLAVRCWAQETSLDTAKFPVCVFLGGAEEWVAIAREELAQPKKSDEELVEWEGHGVRLTPREIARLEREAEEDQKRKAERERQKPWEPPLLDE